MPSWALLFLVAISVTLAFVGQDIAWRRSLLRLQAENERLRNAAREREASSVSIAAATEGVLVDAGSTTSRVRAAEKGSVLVDDAGSARRASELSTAETNLPCHANDMCRAMPRH